MGRCREAESWGNRICSQCELKDFFSPILFSSPLSPDKNTQQCFGGCSADFRLLISVNQLRITDAGQHQPICLIKSQRSLFLLWSEFFPGQAPCYSNLRVIPPIIVTIRVHQHVFLRRIPPPACRTRGF